MSTRRLIVEVTSDATDDALSGYIRDLIADVEHGRAVDLESPRILLDVTAVKEA